MTFEIGDRVKYIGNEYPELAGEYGTVVYLLRSAVAGYTVVSVDWDNELACGWNCYGRARLGHGWNVRAHDLQLITGGEVTHDDDLDLDVNEVL